MLTEFITWTANPALYDGFIEIRWYGLFFAIGFIVGYNMMERMFRHEQVNLKWLDSLFIYVIIATVLGARLGHCLFYAWDYYSQHPLEILKVWEGGLASHGGAIGIIIAIWLYSRRVTHRNMLWTFDRLVVPVALVAALIRTGNLMNHEIYGHVTTLPWGFRFIQNLSEWMKGAAPIFTEPSHPTQIYEALCYLLLFGLLLYMYWKRNAEEREGLIFGTFLIGIFLPRFCIEFIKNNQEAFEETMLLNMGQLLSIPFKDVAAECGVSRAAIHQRVQRLIDLGVIVGSGYHVNPKSLGYRTCTYVGIKLEKGSMYKSVVAEMEKIPEIVECHFTTGPYTMLTKVYARDNEHLMDLLNNKMQEIPGVTATETLISLEQSIKKEIPICPEK